MIRDIVSYVDNRPLSGRVAGLGAMLARRFDARLIGVHVASLRSLPLYLEAGAATEILALLDREVDERADAARAMFERETARHGLTGEWRVDRAAVAGDALVHARHADLVLIGQHDPESGNSTFASLSVPDVALDSGRPTLVVPHSGNFATVGERVIIAWNGSREAARAVHDAMPLLAKAKTVSVLSISPDAKAIDPSRWPGADIATHLARHGIQVGAHHTVAAPLKIADILLNRASDDDADLIVMGAYGHSRIRELVLGGVTRDLLRSMTVPVLMSH